MRMQKSRPAAEGAPAAQESPGRTPYGGRALACLQIAIKPKRDLEAALKKKAFQFAVNRLILRAARVG
jgi:hypothetical protein